MYSRNNFFEKPPTTVLQIHKASAGSGKTFTLTRQYITLLLGKRDASGQFRLYGEGDYGFCKPKVHGSILAITFTNKATQEMTARIVKELALLAGTRGAKEDSAHMEYLTRLFRVPAWQIAEAAWRALTDLLFNFSWFNVSTIDSFFQNILHTFTRELDLPGTFSLEIDEKYPVTVAIGEMTGSVNLPPSATDKDGAARIRRVKSWLKSYMEALIEEGTNANLLARSSKINKELARTITRLRGETFMTHSSEIMTYLSEPDRMQRFVAGMGASLSKLKDAVVETAGALQGLTEYALVGKTLRESYIDRWAAGDFSYSPLEGNRSTLRNAIRPEGKRHIADKPKQGLIWNDEIDDILLRVLKLGLRFFETAQFHRTLRRQIYLLGLFSEACRHIDEYCRENEAFILGDTNSLLRKVICESETPFVYERIGYMINHFLIDEFQDTSEMQWDNLKPLVMESMSRGKDNLIIGDEKQCIYRFRNSNPELLGSKVETAVGTRFGQEQVQVAGVSIGQNTNWRSAPGIVMFNNSVFCCMARLIDRKKEFSYATETYAGLIQQVAPKNIGKGGYVKMIFGPDGHNRAKSEAEAEEQPAEPWTEDDCLRHLGCEIDRELTLGYRPEDIAILVRTHHQGQAVIAYLLDLMKSPGWQHGQIDIISSDALEISTSPAVQLIIGILRLTTTPQYIVDTNRPPEEGRPAMTLNPEFLRNRLIHRYELSVYDRTPLTDNEGNPVAGPDGKPASRRLSAEEALTKAIRATSVPPGDDNPDELQAVFDKEIAGIAQMDCPSLFAITERIIADFVPAESRTSEAAFLTAFQDLVSDFEEQGDADVASFLKWWDSRGRMFTLPAPEGMEAISVMTIHQSKGLEYQCVHVPFCAPPLVKYEGEDWYRLDPDDFPGISPEDVPPFIPLTNRQSYTGIPELRTQIERFAQMQSIDTLNVAYVAFTRAVSELIIYASPVNPRYPDNLGKLLLEAVTSLDAATLAGYGLSRQEMEWVKPLAPAVTQGERGETVLTLGDDLTTFLCGGHEPSAASDPTCQASDTEGQQSVSPFDAEIPYEKILSTYRSERPAEMSLPEDVEQQGVFDITDERHIGNFLHDALARVRTLDDLPLAVERAAYRRAIPPEQWQPYLERLTAALSDPRVRPWFEDFERLMTERPLTASDGLRRPDRVVVMPSGETIVIDYKFGRPDRRYRDQVRDYMALLAGCGFTNLHGYLFHPLTSTLISVD